MSAWQVGGRRIPMSTPAPTVNKVFASGIDAIAPGRPTRARGEFEIVVVVHGIDDERAAPADGPARA